MFFFAFEIKCSIFLRRGSVVPQWGQIFLWIGSLISQWCSIFLRSGSIIPQWGSIFLRRGSIILRRGSVKQVLLVWGLCTTKLRSICKRTGCLWRENRACWLSRLVKLRWNTTEIRRTYRPKSWKILTKPFIWSVRNKMWELWEVNVVKYKNTLTQFEHVQFQTEARVFLSKTTPMFVCHRGLSVGHRWHKDVREETTRTAFSCADWLRSIFHCY